MIISYQELARHAIVGNLPAWHTNTHGSAIVLGLDAQVHNHTNTVVAELFTTWLRFHCPFRVGFVLRLVKRHTHARTHSHALTHPYNSSGAGSIISVQRIRQPSYSRPPSSSTQSASLAMQSTRSPFRSTMHDFRLLYLRTRAKAPQSTHCFLCHVFEGPLLWIGVANLDHLWRRSGAFCQVAPSM